MTKKTKSIIQYIVFFAIAAVLIWLVSKQVADKKEEIIKAFQTADYFWVGVAGIVSIIGHLLRALRWNYLLEPMGHKARIVNSTGAVFIGYLVNYAVMRMGEISRCTIIAKYDKIPFEKAFGTVITERIVDFILLIIVFGFTLLLQFSELFGLSDQYIFSPLKSKMQVFFDKPILGITALVVMFIGMIGLFLLRKKISKMLTGKFGKTLKGFGQGISSVKQTKNKGMFTLLSLGIWVTYLLGIYFSFFAFKETAHLGIDIALVLLLFGTFGVAFAPSGGLGAYQLILFNVLTFYLIPTGAAFALPWVIWATQLIVIVVIGLISFIALPIYNKEKNVA